MGSGSSGRTTTVVSPGGGGQPQIAPEFQPFASSIGSIANQAVTGNTGFNPSSYMEVNPMQTPQATPLDLLVGQQITDRSLYGIPTPQGEQQATQAYSQFLPGGQGVNPAVEAAVRGVKAQTLPVIQNRMAMMGMGQSGAEATQEGQAIAQAVAPIYQQGLTDQLQAAQGLNLIGQQQYQRPIEQMKEGMAEADLQRQLQLAQEQAAYEDFVRRQNIALGYVNPFGSLISSTVPLSSTTTQTTRGSGSSFGK